VPCEERPLLIDGQKTVIEYPLQHGKDINDTLDGVSIHPVTTQKQVSFLTQLLERKETTQGFHQW
jgi:hypothetical protein